MFSLAHRILYIYPYDCIMYPASSSIHPYGQDQQDDYVPNSIVKCPFPNSIVGQYIHTLNRLGACEALLDETWLFSLVHLLRGDCCLNSFDCHHILLYQFSSWFSWEGGLASIVRYPNISVGRTSPLYYASSHWVMVRLRWNKCSCNLLFTVVVRLGFNYHTEEITNHAHTYVRRKR